jgi:hypothetical protein
LSNLRKLEREVEAVNEKKRKAVDLMKGRRVKDRHGESFGDSDSSAGGSGSDSAEEDEEPHSDEGSDSESSEDEEEDDA